MIDELMIIDKAGIPLYYHNFLRKGYIDDNFHLIASFLDQISRFTRAAFKDYLNMIEWKDKIFFFYIHKKTEFLLILKCDNTKIENKEIIKKSLDIIANNLFKRFLLKFKEVLEDFRGDVSQFKTFSEEIDKMFKLK